MKPPELGPTERSYEAIRRVRHPIRPEWEQGARFIVSPPVLFLIMLVATVITFVLMLARFRMFGRF